ncbi:Fc.00g048060.m01.CDS01 [Cosmosporella sp. VM-42]
MSNPIDTETPTGTVGLASATAQKRPSLRVLDQDPEAPATREEDLSNGPSLLGFGVGVGRPEYMTIHPAYLGSDPVFEGLDHHPPEARMLPSIPLGLPTAPSLQTLSLSELSDTGPTFSLSAGSLLSASVSHPETQVTQSTSHGGGTSLFVREYEFSWENSRLCFAGEPFEVLGATEDRYSKAKPDSATASTTSLVSYPGPQAHLLEADELEPPYLAGIGSFGDSVKTWVASELLQDLEMASATRSVPDVSSSSNAISRGNLNTHAPDPVQEIIQQERNIDWMAELLVDDFFRSYAPQRSSKRNNRARNQDAPHTAGNPGTKTRKVGTSTNGKTGPRRGKTVGDSGESEDEDLRGHRQGTSIAGESGNSRRFTCPFLKWNPHRYKGTCIKRLKTISHVKDHLKKIHQEIYCPHCYMIFDEEYTPHCCGTVCAPPIMTADKLKEIKKQSDKRKTPEEQWHRLYKVLFPNEPPCSSPYFTNVEEEQLSYAEHYFRSKMAQKILQEEMQDIDLHSESRAETGAKISELVFHRFLPRVWLTYAPDGEVHSSDDVWPELAHDNDQPIGHAYPNETLDPNVIDRLMPNVTDSYDLQQRAYPTAAIEAFPVPVLTGPSVSAPGAFQDQSSVARGDPLSPTGIGYLGLSGPDAFGLLTEDDFSHQLWSQEHQAYDNGSDLAWNSRFEY